MAIAIDELGIMTEGRNRRETYDRFINRRLAATINTPAVQGLITKMVDERLKQEIDAIVARRTADTLKELDTSGVPRGPEILKILSAVAEATGCSIPEMVGPRRARLVTRPRQFAYHLVRALRPDLSLPAIGRAFNRDHTTIMQGLGVFDTMRDVAPATEWLEHPAIKALTP